MPVTVCPKCAYTRQPSDDHVIAGVCPQCGIAFSKHRPPGQAAEDEQTEFQTAATDENYTCVLPLPQRLLKRLTELPTQANATYFYGRVLIYVVFFVWGWSFVLNGISWDSIGNSFLHNVNLPFHEFGHLLFSPFGRFWAILGGSLFQVLMPLGLMLAFIIKQRDNFGAAIMLWWSGQNFIDVSPYIADAPYRGIPLIGGLGEEAHDWGNLLTMTDTLEQAGSFANVSFVIGCVLIFTSYVWAGWLLWLEKQRGLG